MNKWIKGYLYFCVVFLLGNIWNWAYVSGVLDMLAIGIVIIGVAACILSILDTYVKDMSKIENR